MIINKPNNYYCYVLVVESVSGERKAGKVHLIYR